MEILASLELMTGECYTTSSNQNQKLVVCSITFTKSCNFPHHFNGDLPKRLKKIYNLTLLTPVLEVHHIKVNSGLWSWEKAKENQSNCVDARGLRSDLRYIGLSLMCQHSFKNYRLLLLQAYLWEL